MAELPKRKKNRLPHHDYGENGAYFITICTEDKKNILWKKDFIRRGEQCSPVCYGLSEHLSEYGKILDEAIKDINVHYPHVKVDKYMIMPDHFHLLITIGNDCGRPMVAPTKAGIPRMIQQLKGYVTKKCGISLFQRSYFDRVIRSREEYLAAWKYIDENPCQERK